MFTPGPKQNVFTPPSWNDAYDLWFEELMAHGREEIKKLRLPASFDLMTGEEERTLPRAANMATFKPWPYSVPDCDFVKKFENDLKPSPPTPYEQGYDVALIKVEKGMSSKTGGIFPICFAMSAFLNTNTYNRDYFIAAYGSKGYHDWMNSDWLTWLPLVSEEQIKMAKYENVSLIVPSDMREYASNFIQVVNLDTASGHPITSSVCEGDSGGPVFVMAQS